MSSLDRHIRCKNKATKYPCSLCGYVGSRRDHLAQHMRHTHKHKPDAESQQPAPAPIPGLQVAGPVLSRFSCPFPGCLNVGEYGFAQSWQLEEHQIVHQLISSYTPDQQESMGLVQTEMNDGFQRNGQAQYVGDANSLGPSEHNMFAERQGFEQLSILMNHMDLAFANVQSNKPLRHAMSVGNQNFPLGQTDPVEQYPGLMGSTAPVLVDNAQQLMVDFVPPCMDNLPRGGGAHGYLDQNNDFLRNGDYHQNGYFQ
ncbi:hypothetical protein F4777DRAFT_540624 [Nemania sp. FL0916]|nr:hypothetical protein F4777DRAFT_540624 [Nemania sp. FL0916]